MTIYSVAQVAQQLRVHQETVRRWLREKRLQGTRLGGTRAGYRITQEELDRFMGIPPAPKFRDSRVRRYTVPLHITVLISPDQDGHFPVGPALAEAIRQDILEGIEVGYVNELDIDADRAIFLGEKPVSILVTDKV